MMIRLLESFGVLLKLPCDPWTTDLGGATCAYVLIKDLPMYPTTDIVSSAFFIRNSILKAVSTRTP